MVTQNSAFPEIIIDEENKDNPEPSNTEKRKPARSTAYKIISFEAFLGLFDRIRRRPNRNRYLFDKESNVYRRLMDDLEDEEDPPSSYAKLFVALQMVVILGLTAALVATLKVERIKHLREWQWVVRVMLLVFGLSAVRIVTFLVAAPVKWWWRTHKCVVYYVCEMKLCVDVTLWLGLGLVAWYLWFKPRLMNVNVKGHVSTILAFHITRLLIALAVGSLLWLLKNLLYLKLKADLLHDHLFDKIQRTVIDFHFLQIIYKSGVWKFLNSEKNRRKKMKKKQTQGQGDIDDQELMSMRTKRNIKGLNIWMDVSRMKMQTVPICITRRLADTYLKHSKPGLPRNWDDTKDEKLLKEAQQLFRRVSTNRSDIRPENLRKYELDEHELEFLFGIFDEDEGKEERMEERLEAKTITKDQFLSWAVVAYKNCWGLERTLLSSKRIFIKLNRILNTFLLSIVLIIWLLLSKIVDTAQLALLFSPFFAASFIFGDSCKKMFEGLIFAFAMHPFDVGDRVVVDNAHMKVSQLNIMTSVFLIKDDTGEEEVVFPNSLLASTKIVNLDVITDDQADCLEFNIPSSTPSEDITDLELKIKMALDDGLTYSSQTKVVKKEIGKEEIKMAVYFKYLVPYLVAETKAMHRSSILTKIMDFTKEIDVDYRRWLSVDDNQEIVPVEFTLDAKLTMTLHEINVLKEKILEAFKGQCIKLLLKGLDKKEIKMVLYLSYPKGLSEASKLTEKWQVRKKICTFTDPLNIICLP